MRTIALFGGSFNPIHLGHINTSLKIQSTYHFDSYLFLPCKQSPLKSQGEANRQQRVAMLKLALEPYKEFAMDLREINRDGPSYMVDTLKSFKNEAPKESITLVLGYDAFLSLPQWYQWEQLTTLAHLLVIQRPNWSKQELPETLKAHIQKHPDCISFFDAGQYDYSSSQIRQDIKMGLLDVSSKLQPAVYQYIKQQGLYQ